MVDEHLITQTATIIHNGKRLTVLTGAGVSKESGVPTFRDAVEGLWAKYDPQQLATPTAFINNPKLVWDWYEFRREMMRGARPNPGHYALAQLEQRYPHLQVITQNIDDLHEQAGSQRVLHLHGRIQRNKCFYNCQGDPTIVDVETLDWDRENGLPLCPYCGRWVRPDVVWFGENLPQAELAAAVQASEATDVMLVIGTSGLVTPAASMPIYAKQRGATIIEINPDSTALSSLANIRLSAPSGEMLPRVLKALDEMV